MKNIENIILFLVLMGSIWAVAMAAQVLCVVFGVG